MPSIFMASLGCVKNLVDAETTLGETLGDDYTLELDPYKADIILVNTCGFIEDARVESREAIDTYLDIKRSADHPIQVIAMGCLTERQPEEIAAAFPDLDAVWGLETPASLAEPLRRLTPGSGPGIAWIGKPAQPREGARLVSTLPSYAYLRIADGCDNRCHYCAIPLIRGGMKSRDLQSVLDEARDLEQQGVKELILAAQDTTAFGMDKPGSPRFAHLLDRLLRTVEVGRIRVLYAHPAHLEQEALDMLLAEPRLCRYIDLPLQHIADPILKAMGRGYGKAEAMDILGALAAGGAVIRTTFMTGFPGETESDFLQVLDLVKSGIFKHVGAFAYSPEQGTPAAGYPDPVPSDEAERRRDAVMRAQAAVAFGWLDSRIGSEESVLVDGYAPDGGLIGRTAAEAPDSDGMVYLRGVRTAPGQVVKACITARIGYDLVAGDQPGHRTRRDGGVSGQDGRPRGSDKGGKSGRNERNGKGGKRKKTGR